MKFVVSAIALLLAACASVDNPGTAPAPATAWTPPASAVPPVTKFESTLPANTTLTLADVVNIAVANNPQTREAWLNARTAEANLGSRQSAYYPEVDLNATAGRSIVGASPGRASASSTTVAPSLALSYLLFDFGGRAATVEEARQTLIAADFEHNQAIQNVVLTAETSYFQYLDAKALLGAQAGTLKERQAELDTANARHDAGLATIADVLQARTALSQAQLTYETIEGNLRTIEGTLATAMGLPATTHFDFGELPSTVATDETSQAVDALIAQATVDRPDLAAARADAERARAHITEVRSAYLPSLTLNSTTGRTFFLAPNALNATNSFSASIGLRFPLFTGFRNVFDERAARLQAELALEDVRDLTQQVGLQVWSSYYAVQTAKQRVTTSRDLLASAQESANVAAARYREGVGTILDVLTAQSALETARAQEVQSRADYLLALAELAHATGKLGAPK
ncbi:MAG TPA: TolC family protein [Thermoanaerobaculia bacterium]|nr:TolC family protein [Thermoanaerobaculia bacterium]